MPLVDLSQMRTLKAQMVCRYLRPHSRAGTKSLKGLSSRAGGFLRLSGAPGPVWAPHTGSAGQGTRSQSRFTPEASWQQGSGGRERAGLRDAVPGRLGKEVRDAPTQAPPPMGKDMFPSHLVWGQAWELRGVGEGGSVYIRGVCILLSTLAVRPLWCQEARLSHALLSQRTRNKRHRGCATFPRATQLSAEGTGHQLRLRHCHGGARGSL